MSLFSSRGLNLSMHLGVDLGTANTLVYERGRGLVLNQPSVVAMIRAKGYEIPYLFGDSAKIMMGKTPPNITVHRPLQDGVIADFRVAEEMIKHFVRLVIGKWNFFRPTVVVCVPFESTDVERRAIQTAVEKCGTKEVWLIEEPMAAAVGASLPVSDPKGSMVVDIGGGTTEIAIISLGGVVHGRSIKVAGDAMDKNIIAYMRQKYSLLIGQATAESIKKQVGIAFSKVGEPHLTMKVRGRDLVTGTPNEITVSQEDTYNSLSDCVADIIDAIRGTLETAPPELASDIVDRGVVLTGGGAMLKNLDYAIGEATCLPVFVAPNPLYCVAIGVGTVVSDYNKYANVLFRQS